MKKFFDWFRKKSNRNVSRKTVITAGTDLEGKYSLSMQEVNDVWCICVHKCEIRGGFHYTSFDNNTLVCAIPIKGIVNLCMERQMWWRED